MRINSFTFKHAVGLAQFLTLHASQTLTHRMQVELLAALTHNSEVRDTLFPAAPNKTLRLLWLAVADAPNATRDATCNALCLAALAAENRADALGLVTRAFEKNSRHEMTRLLFTLLQTGFPFERLRSMSHKSAIGLLGQFNEDPNRANRPFVLPDTAVHLD